MSRIDVKRTSYIGRKGPDKIAATGKVIRAAGAIVFFGIPALALTTVLVGYGVHKLCKAIRQSSQ